MNPKELTQREKSEIAEILSRRANELASFKSDLEEHAKMKFNSFPGSAELAISREIKRLRGFVDKLVPVSEEEEP